MRENDLGFKAGNLRRGAEHLNVGVVLLWGEERLLGTPLHFWVGLVLGHGTQENVERAQM